MLTSEGPLRRALGACGPTSDIVSAPTMPGDASTLPLRGTTATRPQARVRMLLRGRAGERAGAEPGVRAGALALATVVALSLFLVLVAANRPGPLTPTTHAGYFPRWMAGPLGGLLAGFTDNGTTLRWGFTGVIIVMYGAYLLALRHVRRLPARWVIAAIVAVHVIFLLAPPLSLTDLFNYVNYGRMEVFYNLNPYTTIPILEPHSDPAFLLSNWHELLSPYGPLFTLITFAVVPLGIAGSFWALKAILMVTSLATILLVWKSARLLGRDPLPAVVLAGMNPVVLVWGLGGDHNDFLMVFCIVLGFYLLLRGGVRARAVSERSARSPEAADARAGRVRAAPPPEAADASGGRGRAAPRARAWTRPGGMLPALSAFDMGAGAAFVSAVAIKASAAVLLPVLLAGVVRAPRRLASAVLGMLVCGLLLALASILAFGPHLPDLSTQSQLVASESIPNLIGLALGLGGESLGLRAVMDGALIVSVLVCCWWVWDRRAGARRRAQAPLDAGGEARAITAAGWASMALLVTLSWVLPWYVVWVLPLAALSRSRRLRTAALVFGVYLIAVWSPASSSVLHALHFRPERTQLGRVHQRFVKELLD